MTTVDMRTRTHDEVAPIDPTTFLRDVAPAAVDANGLAAGAALERARLPPLTLDVAGEPVTFAAVGGRATVEHRADEHLVVQLDVDAFADLAQDVSSGFGLQMTGRAQVRRGDIDAFVAWEPVLRCLLDGRPVHQAGSVTFSARDGGPLDLHRSFRLDDDPAEIGHFLAEAGFLHLEGVFTEDEMAAVSTDLDDAIASARPDDGESWWATTADGTSYAARILGFNRRSAALQAVLATERFRSIGTFTDDEMLQRDPSGGDAAEGLLKKQGVVEGISDVSWHKDCAMGGHSRRCCSLVVGISVTGAGPENGELGVVPGSHRANVPPLGVEGLDLDRLPLPTRTGDVTVHCSCTLHMSRPPVSAERRVVYTGFDLAPRSGDVARQLSEEEVMRRRASMNDHVRSQQRQGSTPVVAADFEL